jgi:polysaccharide export outer membrane protein
VLETPDALLTAAAWVDPPASAAPPPTGGARAPGKTWGERLVSARKKPAKACDPCPGIENAPLPRELAKTSLPPYVIETPDILLIDAVRVVPRPPYRIEPLDALLVQVTDGLPNEPPLAAAVTVEPDGTVNLGPTYGSFLVADKTLEEARQAIEQQLRQTFTKVRVGVSLAQTRAAQQIRGEHLVRPDGTVALGVYGSVHVSGRTLDEAKAAIEAHLANFLLRPEVSVDVFSYNSKVYYVITDGGGYGEQVYRLPSTGNETVLDAIGQILGLPAVASKRRIWVARPSPDCAGCDLILPVNWRALTQCGKTATNYQIFPGDRIYVQAQPLITADAVLARVLAPVERILGVTLLGASTVQSIQTVGQGGGVGGIGGF